MYYRLLLLDKNKNIGLCTSAFNLWWQPCRAPCKETAGSGTPALELETELLESIIHHLGHLLQLLISEFQTLKNFYIRILAYKNLFVFSDIVTIMKKCESFLFNVMYFYSIFTTVKIAFITCFPKKIIKIFNVIGFYKNMLYILLTQLFLLLLYLQIILYCL